MPGTDRVFIDIQFLKPWKENDYKFTVFSRTRMTVDYSNQPNFFSAAYANYTSKPGLGISVIGSVSNGRGFSPTVGINYLKVRNDFSIFLLVAMELEENPEYSLFTISKYRPSIGENWKLYTSLELFSLVNHNGHQVSVQRARVGVDRKSLQFGVAANLGQYGSSPIWDDNYGIFIRKEF